MDVIVNADDLGMNPQINRGIFDLMGLGLVTSATVLANGTDVEAACDQIPGFPHCSFGVHLNVTEFRPLIHSSKLEPLLDENGEFERTRIRQVSIDSSLADGIFEEFCAFEKFFRVGE